MGNYPTEKQAREQICDYGRRLYARGMVAANAGNLSCKVSEQEIVITPTGVSKGFMEPEMLLRMELTANELPVGVSSETRMHLQIYRENPKVNAVVHAHPPLATVFCMQGKALECIMPDMLIHFGASIPLAAYATTGTAEVAESVIPFCTTHNACLLANHGPVIWSHDLRDAYYKMELLENYCRVYLCATRIVGHHTPIPEEKIGYLLDFHDRKMETLR